jgi:hypothetical protein
MIAIIDIFKIISPIIKAQLNLFTVIKIALKRLEINED